MTFELPLAIFLLYFILLAAIFSYKTSGKDQEPYSNEIILDNILPDEVSSPIEVIRASIKHEGLILDSYKVGGDIVRNTPYYALENGIKNLTVNL